MFNNHWDPFLQNEFQQPYFQQLSVFLRQEYSRKTVYPPKTDVFNAFRYTDLPDIKCVILGQDPYFHEGQACGMCFAVKDGTPFPPSLKNIFQELHDDLDIDYPHTGYLLPWARQGVMLLNTVMTVEADKALSHRGRGWETFTDHAIEKIDSLPQPIVYLLWGKQAQSKKALLHSPGHLILEAAHPSPLSAYSGFFGCQHFSKANQWLKEQGTDPIDWRLP